MLLGLLVWLGEGLLLLTVLGLSWELRLLGAVVCLLGLGPSLLLLKRRLWDAGVQ